MFTNEINFLCVEIISDEILTVAVRLASSSSKSDTH